MSSPVVGSREKPGTGGMKSLPLTLEKAVSLAPSVLPFCAAIKASRSGREIPSGTSLMLSAPPAIATWWCPAVMACAASVSAWIDVAQARDTLKASTSLGMPEPSTTSRAMFSQSSVGTT